MVDVLLCDDNPEFLSMLRTVLEVQGFKVDSCLKLSQAVRLLLKQNYKMAIIAIGAACLQELDDKLESLKTIHEAVPQIPFVLVCSQTTADTERVLHSVGAFYLLTKPFSFWELRQAIESAIRKHDRDLYS